MIFSSVSFIQNIMLTSNFLVPLIVTAVSMPYFIRKLTENNIVAKDVYKKGLPTVADRGGTLILLIAMLSLSMNSLFFKFTSTTYVAMIVIALFGLFGVLDDMVNIGRTSKLLIMYYCSYPLIQYATHTAVTLPSVGDLELGIVYLQFIVPTYVLVASNLVNMHSGFNGLASGLSIIVLVSLIIKSVLIHDVENIISVVAITGATIGFYLYEQYPARIFWGNVGSLTVGAAIGTIIVIQGFIISGFIMLIPHTINFLLYVYWKIKKYPAAKFGTVREDGTLEVPNALTLKWILPYHYRLTEKQATYAMFLLTSVFCVAGILLPGRL
ncbi:MraY family glycosyltransferase [Methanosarcina mazei]|uniref:UDP-N-acetylglucosamine-1-phosphate transferase n=2 Tax=Methanosarcina mazei TaxID=2209 RepID=A0A0F8TBC5_METMZ|nr:glycosyltransferase 4 family protein [Methanosarcina mazei]UWJ21326.1 Phospho-N-acetylmuramoyl-pentapeptide- transferase [Methanosarcina mazei TMA]KKG05253.1 UDP-N-acetylglucosamine-1-phosphate transferase [Methanosarcina mazei]KKG56852.1 UDP-N-acetylglucosamine-1-phosphate transferase [Methanosarcina mazei]KKG58890.1 UDP-N-acetylglucosamine-1-phosphate transferase [Methanosarcina mazei]KKG63150.1 UDP-N-acetylglucosamine-1-phosphate transferase [Methanosarcina mazei]